MFNTQDTLKDFSRAVSRLGVDMDVFDFYRMDDPHGYAMTVCPCCQKQAEVHRKPNAVLLICTKCGTEAEWECEVDRGAPNALISAYGSVQLTRLTLGN